MSAFEDRMLKMEQGVESASRGISELREMCKNVQGQPIIRARSGARFELNADLNVLDLLRRLEALERR
jgi:hypothetical protein